MPQGAHQRRLNGRRCLSAGGIGARRCPGDRWPAATAAPPDRRTNAPRRCRFPAAIPGGGRRHHGFEVVPGPESEARGHALREEARQHREPVRVRTGTRTRVLRDSDADMTGAPIELVGDGTTDGRRRSGMVCPAAPPETRGWRVRSIPRLGPGGSSAWMAAPAGETCRSCGSGPPPSRTRTGRLPAGRSENTGVQGDADSGEPPTAPPFKADIALRRPPTVLRATVVGAADYAPISPARTVRWAVDADRRV